MHHFNVKNFTPNPLRPRSSPNFEALVAPLGQSSKLQINQHIVIIRIFSTQHNIIHNITYVLVTNSDALVFTNTNV